MQKYALIIGNDTYDDPRFKALCAPIADVKHLTNVLADPQIGSFDVQSLINEHENKISRALERFFRDRQRDDLLLVHFSGHGIKDINGKLFLAVKDTDPDAPTSSSISARFITELIDQCKSQRIFLMLDCCYAGAFAEGTRGVVTPVGSKQAFEGTGYGRWYLTASDETQYAFEGAQVDGNAQPSVFTRVVVEGLRTGKADVDGDELVSVRDLNDYVYKHVRDLGYKQTPCFWSYKERGELLIAETPTPELPTDLVSATRSRNVHIKCEAVNELLRILKKTRPRRLANLARAEIIRLADDDSKQVSHAANSALAEFLDSAPTDLVDGQLTEVVEEFRKRESQSAEDSNSEWLATMLQAAACLKKGGTLDESLEMAIEAALRLTGGDRGFAFVRDDATEFRLAAAIDRHGKLINHDISFPVLPVSQMLNGDSEFLFFKEERRKTPSRPDDALQVLAQFNSVCIPLRKRDEHALNDGLHSPTSLGVLYLDARITKCDFSSLSPNLLRTIARGATALLEQLDLEEIVESHRRYQQELSIAASIQQRLMTVNIPEVPFARLVGRNISCKEIGGDFFDAVAINDTLAFVLADVSGKGVSAALLASTIHGVIYAQLTAGFTLPQVADSVNKFLTQKGRGEKYATLCLARIHRDGRLEYVNCAHVPALLVSDNVVTRPQHGNIPVGLLADATFESDFIDMKPGDRLVMVTDGVTEAEDATGEFFDNERLEATVGKGGIDEVFEAVSEFSGGTPLQDDCTVVELTYTGL